MLRNLFRGYFKLNQLPIWKQDVMANMLPNLINCREHKEFLYVNESQLPPNILAESLNTIAALKLPRDEHWPEICILVKRQMRTFDMECSHHLFKIGRAMGWLGEKNNEMWEILEQKLVTEGLVRYFSEEEAAGFMYALSLVGKGSDELWKRLERIVSDYYVSLEKQDLILAIDALASTERSSELLGKLQAQLEGYKLLN